MDYARFRQLFEDGVQCYILNTGFFTEKKVPKEMTLTILESIVEEKAQWKRLGGIEGMEYMPIEGFEPDFGDAAYRAQFANRMNDRLKFVKSRDTAKGGIDKLPQDAHEAIEKVINSLK